MKVLTEGPPMGRLESSIFSRKGNVTSPVMLNNCCAQCYNIHDCDDDVLFLPVENYFPVLGNVRAS